MISVTFKPHKTWPQSLHRHIDKMVKAAAEQAGDGLRAAVSFGPRTGKKHPGLPNRSSKVGEYPQEQFSHLKNSVDVVQTARMFYKVGFLGDDPKKLIKLEYGLDTMISAAPAATRTYRKGQRKPLFRFFVGKDGKTTRKAMNAAAQAAA